MTIPSSDFPSPLGQNEKPIGAVMVIGGGIAGMQASLDLADSGFKVFLVEKQPAIGGHMAALDKTFPTNDCAMCIVGPKLVATASHHNIELLTLSELIDLEGQAGHFKATVRRNPRYIDVAKCTACGDCATVCPVDLDDRFNGGLGRRKAAYKLYPQAVPNAYAIEKTGVAPCRDACPAGQRAQGYIALIREGRYKEALRVIKEDNPFPGICGRICSHRCETACNRSLVDGPVAIAALKRFVADTVYADPYTPPETVQRKYSERIAIIGSGPCGLTAAKDLTELGYGVTVFEALPVAGGMLRVGVPEYRLPARIINKEVQEIVDLGVELRLNSRVEHLESLFEEGFDAVLLAVGAHEGKRLKIPGADHPDVRTAVNFLRNVRLTDDQDLNGRHVLVLGGGDVAMDCARTALRLGAKKVDVACLESQETMPASKDEIAEARAEGIQIMPDRSFSRILHAKGRVTGVEALAVRFMRFEQDGSLTLETVQNSEHVLACDLVFFAVGQRASATLIPHEQDFGLTEQGLIAVNPSTFATSRPGVFAAGDATTGTATVIDAVAAGHKAARSLNRYLRNQPLETHDRSTPTVARMSRAQATARMGGGLVDIRPRAVMPVLEAENRRQSFEEVKLGFAEQQARAEAARCLQCGACAECLCCVTQCAAKAINHDEVARTEQIEVGAVILATGFEPFDARLQSEYGLGRFPNVVTGMQFERILSPSGPYSGHLRRPSDGHEPKRIAWIQCVGSRSAARNWCSSVCCMYATKQAMIAQEHAPGTVCTIFFIDFRAFGKGFDAYFERAKKAGVRYVRAMPAKIRQEPDSEDLCLRYALPGGEVFSETFDLVVLSVGLQPADSAEQLRQVLHLELNEDGFCRTIESSPVDTLRKGVYACGPFVQPIDIPETVMSASAAAARAMTLLAESRHSLVRPKAYPPEIDVSGQPPRVGVFVCHCGTNIAGVVDVETLTEYARSLPEVVHADRYLFTCSTDSQARIRKAIEDHQLNRVVVASCTPRTHERLFQETIREAGLNFYLFEMANIRDQCSWVHRDVPEAATEKAKDLLRMAIAKVRLVQPLQRKSLEFNHDALIIGGGLAGMNASLELADQGYQVTLIERQDKLGGNMNHLRFLLPGADPQELLHQTVGRTLEHPNIRTFLNAEIDSFEGSLGKFKTKIYTHNGHAGHENTAAVIQHGVVIVATGAQAYRPTEYLYGQDPRVLTQFQLEALLADNPDQIRTLKSIVMIQCVGSRTDERPYCSRVCCTQAIKNALQIKQVSTQTEVYILYRDLRTYGTLENYYRQARAAGVVFLRFEAAHPPQARQDGRLQVTLRDALLDEEITLDADRLVLSVGTVANPDAESLAQLLKVPRTTDGFFQEAHLKLAPVDFATEGIYLCGMAQYPKRALTESVVQAKAAAGRAATILGRPTIEIEPTISHVLEEKCDGCAYCVEPCPYNAITLIEYQDESGQTKKRVQIDEALCKGCGTCQATCPKDAIFVWHFRPDQLRAMTMAALET